MISGNYLANFFRAHRVALAFSFVFVGAFQLLIISMVVGMDLLGMIEQLYRQMPPQFRMVMGDQVLAAFTVNGVVAFGYAHPLVMVLTCTLAIWLPSRHIAGEIENGTLELLFAQPVRRTTIAGSLWLASVAALLLIVVGCWTGTWSGRVLFPETADMPVGMLFRIGTNLWLLAVAISSYTLLIAAYARESGRVATRAAGLTLVLYLINFSSLVWEPLGRLRPLSVFYYHQPPRMLMGQSSLAVNATVLGAVAVVCTVLAVRRIHRRDIPGS